jgi:hypothetical protein
MAEFVIKLADERGRVQEQVQTPAPNPSTAIRQPPSILWLP